MTYCTNRSSTHFDYNGAIPMLQYITSHTLQSTLRFTEIQNVKLRPRSPSPGTVQLNFVFAFVICSKYPVALKHVLDCSELCWYFSFRLDWRAHGTGLIRLLFHYKIHKKRLV